MDSFRDVQQFVAEEQQHFSAVVAEEMVRPHYLRTREKETLLSEGCYSSDRCNYDCRNKRGRHIRGWYTGASR
jgi:hypothetical protein